MDSYAGFVFADTLLFNPVLGEVQVFAPIDFPQVGFHVLFFHQSFAPVDFEGRVKFLIVDGRLFNPFQQSIVRIEVEIVEVGVPLVFLRLFYYTHYNN